MANLSNINNKFLVTTGGNVLIGQTGAVGSSIFQVTGNATFGGNVTLSSALPLLYLTNTTASTGKNWRLSSATNGKFFITQEGVVDAVTLDHTSGNATFAGTVTAVGVSSTIASATSGYFATGTAIPANQILHVRDNVGQVATNSAGGIKISSSPGNDVFLLKRNDGGTSYFALQNSSATEFITTNMATGNVGIGDTSPEGKLDVVDGNAKMIFKAGSSDRPYLQLRHDAVPVDGEELAIMDFSGFNDASQTTRYGIIIGKAEDVSDGSEDGTMSFLTMKAGTATNTMVLRSGNVGIGTDSPTSTLTLGNATDNVAELRVLRSNSVSGTYGFINTIGGTAQIGGSGDTRIIASSGRLLFNSNNTDQISLESNGEYRLKLGSTTTGYEASMDNSNTAYRIFGSRFGGTGKYVAIWSDGANENARFYPTKTIFYQSVGIGTTNPLEKLNVAITTATAGTFFPLAISGARYQADYGVGIAFRPENNSGAYSNKTAIVGSGGGYGYNMADLHFCFNNDAAIGTEVSLTDAKVTMKRSGNVGIGTTAPAEKLTIDGTTSGAYVRISNAASGDISSGYTIYNGTNLDYAVYTNPTFGNTTLLTREALAIRTGGSERMRVNSSGQLLIETTSSQTTAKLGVRQNGSAIEFGHDNQSVGYYGTLGATYSSGNPFIAFRCFNNSTIGGNNFATQGHKGNVIFSESNGDLIFAQATTTTSSSQSLTERIRLKNDGNVGIGLTNPTYKLHVASSNNVSIFEDTSDASGAAFIVFNRPGVFSMGSITRNGSANSVSYNTGSDYRLKEDLKDFNALDLVNNITAYDYKWKDVNQRDYGFIAHELKQTLPNVVTGEKDGEKMQGVDYSKLTPILLKAIQELKAEIELLKNK